MRQAVMWHNQTKPLFSIQVQKKPRTPEQNIDVSDSIKSKKLHTPKNVAEKGDWKKAKASVGNSDTFLHVWFTFLVISNFW